MIPTNILFYPHPEHNLRIFCYNKRMRIGIDARMYGPSVGGGGLGRYIEQFLKELPNVDQQNRYVLFGSALNLFRDVPNFDTINTRIPWYSLQEQIQLPRVIDGQRLDLIHFPHWNVPLRLKTPFVVTIHDLILLKEPRSARATTRHPFVYALKYQGFKRVLSHAVEKSQKIITISEATKHDLITYFPRLSPQKITVIYEGVTKLPPSTSSKSPLPFPYLLYVGNCYPHKHLEFLLDVFDRLHPNFPDLHLVFAGRDDRFSQMLERTSKTHSSGSHIRFMKNPPDTALCELYTYAQLYVFPSRVEGFGLPPLEAMAQGTPVACSNIPVLQEILGNAAVYFPQDNAAQAARILTDLLHNPQERTELIEQGFTQIQRYSWKDMAQQIQRLYLSCEHP